MKFDTNPETFQLKYLTAKLWMEYMVNIMGAIIRSERIGEWFLYQATPQEMLTCLTAYCHLHRVPISLRVSKVDDQVGRHVSQCSQAVHPRSACCHGYNFTMTHRPGSQNQLADGLSRLPSPDNVTTIDRDLRVDLVRFSTERLDKVRRDTSLDAVLNQLVETIIAGWPEDVKDLPPDIRSFWSFRDQLSVGNGLVLKGQQLVIPRMQQPEILRQLHTAHLGTEKTKLLARDTVYWLNINKDID